MCKIWDISQTLSANTPVWPGDTAYRAYRTVELTENCPVNISKLELSTHTGSHADAPLHYDNKGLAIDQVDVSHYIGPCIVINATSATNLIEPEHIIDQLPATLERVLLKTYQTFPGASWDNDFTAISVDTVELLASRGAFLIGIDSPSLDPQNSKQLDAHHCVRKHQMAILEGLVLDDIEPGEYELIAPPLKLAGMDASPVRALLRSINK